MKTIRKERLSNGQMVWLKTDGFGGYWIFFADKEGNFDEYSGQTLPQDVICETRK